MSNVNDGHSGFIDYKEQIHRLREKGIKIPLSDDSFETAISILSTVPYRYLSNTYRKIQPLLKDEEIPLEQLYLIHVEFNNLHNILLKYILIIEQSLKNKLSYFIARKYGVETDYKNTLSRDPRDYLCINHYTGDKYNRIIKIKQTIQSPYKGSSLEYYKNIKNNIPPWIVLENLPLGKVINWYTVLKNADKSAVCRSLFLFQPRNLMDSDSKELVSKSLAILHEYRNLYAHRYREHKEYIRNELPCHPMMIEYSNILFFDEEHLKGKGIKDLQALINILCIFSPNLTDYVQLVEDLSNFKRNYIEKSDRMQTDSRIKFDPYALFGLSEDILKRLVDFVANQYV